MNAIRDIAQLGNHVLRQISEPVTDVDSEAAKTVIQAMKATLESANGVGLAAPQISELKRIVIVASRPSVRYPHAPEMQPTVMINPVCEILSDEKEKDWEGCLSIPGIRALVPRNRHIKVSYLDESGESKTVELEGFVARVYQHEADHLDGFVYLDRVESSKDIISESEYLKLFNLQPMLG